MEFEPNVIHEESEAEKLNPFTQIWIKPRQVIRQILNSNSSKYVILLAMIGGISQVLDNASIRNNGDKLDYPYILLIALIGGPLGGILSLYVSSALIKWTGNWIGGRGTFKEIRIANAWSNVPTMWALLLWIPQIILFGRETFTSKTPIIDSNLVLKVIYLFLSFVELVIGLWIISINIKCIGEAQQFSSWKALANIILSWAVILVPLLVILIGIFTLLSGI